ncbi:histone deacetylase complex protein [Desarmillaria tabescens]|uniref:Histone deacetylase complex protein n=1 Tax=Armillaria tabescens TaxID=1929756 RepID=A0AA39JJQ5_ARMTA|nr:histone deacetylase complex protein [Desarmillaria tabescens]KAK0443918.1 histone deacetylase complex protein [Desarmillaria tabescens]
MNETTPAGQPIVSREKTAPFLIRTFIKIGSFHRIGQFEDGPLPTTDEQQIFTWKDATLREVLTTIRNSTPMIQEYRHPLARFSFRTVYADPGNKGRFASKDLGQVYSRDILGEPGSLTSTAPRLLEDIDGENREPTEREREERTLDELRFVPGDYLLVAVFLPKSVAPPESNTRAPPFNGWKAGGPGIGGSPVMVRGGGGHWRGDSNGLRGRGGGRGGGVGDRDLEDSRVPPPRRGDRGNSPPPRETGWGRRGGRGGRGGGRRSRSRSRSRTPPLKKSSRYD